ncbi:fructosamine kinase family protein [Nocardia sp. CDC159]|uniref:Fructosamine kinase family protein n=1 Tax=Nocardia pulmonis TaxID=2951408 RepID=A0A9X2E6K1_9NOCA|nr:MULTISPECIES: fructosamine kinase family protein [Nocardia]MCM6772438.1 fructosamine kinase family protein [Nocardia pulmonis]MCM6784904.1 fructosamine kinase family protein [Nocardia sp. CDC159]
MSDPATRLHTLLGVPVVAVTDLGHSHAWTLRRARLADGRDIFVKALDPHRQPDAGRALAAEAASLRWLGEGDTDGLIPEVLAADPDTLVLPWLPETAPAPPAAERFGRELAALHSRTPDAYGAPWPGFIAALPQDNSQSTGEWGSWYAEHRLAPMLRAAAPTLGEEGVHTIERVIFTIDNFAGPSEPPSRIHGDLWSGNIRWTPDGARLIDPAAHGGHRETDLAMLALFGAPHLDRILAAYQESAPLEAGWRQRVPLHQLYPLLVHVALFGGAYRAGTLDAARAILAG